MSLRIAVRGTQLFQGLLSDKGIVMPHAVLLGDSILDNGAYVAGGLPVVDQLRSELSGEWRTTLLARDGAVITGVQAQIRQLPGDASHLVFSVGGNDAIRFGYILQSPAATANATLRELGRAQAAFQDDYEQLIRTICELGLPAVGCTIYDAVPGLRSSERLALCLFNDVIIRTLADWQIPILDLRAVCNEPADYSTVSPIEPSAIGGLKIAKAVQRILDGHDFSRRETVLYP